MKIRKASLTQPDADSLYAISAVCLTIVISAYSFLIGQKGILFVYALWLPLAFIDPRRVLARPVFLVGMMVFPALACVSALWSVIPDVTLRAGLQYVSTIACALVAARVVSIPSMAKGILLGVALVLAFSFAVGASRYSAIDQSYAFAGAFASKNQFGYVASLGFIAALSLFLMGVRGWWLIPELIVGAESLYALVLAQSATSTISIVVALGLIAGLSMLLLVAPGQRRTLLIVGGIVGIGGVLGFLVLSGGSDILLGLFGKDSTLTGRTYLWSEGLRAAEAAPFFGMGYQVFWTQGLPHAERLWAEFAIPERYGFHFHNTYVEILVCLGYFGLALMVTFLVATTLMLLRRSIARSASQANLFLLALVAMLLVRSFFEEDFLAPYTIGAFLLVYSAAVAIPGAAKLSNRRARTRRAARFIRAPSVISGGLPASA